MFKTAKNLYSMTLIGSVACFTTYDLTRSSTSYMSCFTEPPTRDRIRGEYENKIRSMSPPEKIFEVFAMHKKGKDIYMSHSDLFQAICPYNYTTKPRDYSHDHEHEKDSFESSAVVKFADSDRNGLISLYEYYFFVGFMQTNIKDIVNFFGSLQDRSVTKKEFNEFLDYIKNKKMGRLTISNVLPDPRKQRLSEEGLLKVQQEITNNVFDNKNEMKLSKILELRDLIYTEIYQYEFNSYEKDESSNIKGEDFAKSIICYLDPAVINKYWRDLSKVDWQGSVTLNEYVAFQKFLRENIHKMEERIEEKGVLSKKKLREIISEFCKAEKVNISKDQLNIFLRVLDSNENNRIDHDEFVGVIKNRSFYGSGDGGQKLEKPFVVVKKSLERFADKLVRIYDIIKE